MTKFKCAVCGKVTVLGRLPRNGDGTFYFPRRHRANGKPCEGNTQEAQWIEEDPARMSEYEDVRIECKVCGNEVSQDEHFACPRCEVSMCLYCFQEKSCPEHGGADGGMPEPDDPALGPFVEPRGPGGAR